MNNNGVIESRLYMWQVVLTVAHADQLVTPEEVDYLSICFKKDPLSRGQTQLLMSDIQNPQNPENMFLSITNQKDRQDFFTFAESLAHIDGDYDHREKKLITRLKSLSS